ncbi:hypothetical protein GWI33_009003, partial [Rhynchophorus ferrugineus]
VYRDNNKIC